MRSYRTTSVLLAAAVAAAASPLQAQVPPATGTNPSHTLRITPAAAGYSATLTSFSGPYRYRNVPLHAEGCGTVGPQPPFLIDKATLKRVTPGARQMRLRVPAGPGGVCLLVGDFALEVDDTPPIDADDDSPIQGGSGVKPPLELPDMLTLDISAAPTAQLGGRTVYWGSDVTLDASRALVRGGGVCTFAYSYKTANNGGVAESTDNTLSLAAGGALLARNGLPALHRGDAITASGGLGLRPGWSTLVLNVDSPDWLPEVSETNNSHALRVRVTGSCD